MEYVEILDNNGNDTGRTIDKKEAHRKGYFHHTVHIWIVNDNNEVLLQKRSPRKNPHPDKWDLTCGGHLICNENSIDGAVRELEEEIGIHFNKEDLKYIFTYKKDTFDDKEFQDVYLLKVNLDVSKLKLNETEVTMMKYIPINYLYELSENNYEKDINNEYTHRNIEYNKQLFSHLINKD